MAIDRKGKIRDSLDGALTNLMAVLPGADNEPGWEIPTGEHNWNVREILAHLVVAEKSMNQLIEMALKAKSDGQPADTLVQRGSDGSPFDLDRWNARQIEKRLGQPASALRNELAEIRTATLRALAALPEEDLEITAWHPQLGITTIEGVYRIIGIHMKDHTRAMKQALKAGLQGRYWNA